MAHRISSPRHGTLPGLCVLTTIPQTKSNRDEYLAPIPEAERGDLILAYHAQLNSVDDETRLNAAKAWAKWEWVSNVRIMRPPPEGENINGVN